MSKTSYLLSSLTACAVSLMFACGAPQQDQNSTEEMDQAPVTMTQESAISETTPEAVETPEAMFTPEATEDLDIAPMDDLMDEPMSDDMLSSDTMDEYQSQPVGE